MVVSEHPVISPYLERAVRSLPEACRDIHRAHGDGAPACGSCPFRSMCAHSRSHKAICAEARNRHQPFPLMLRTRFVLRD